MRSIFLFKSLKNSDAKFVMWQLMQLVYMRALSFMIYIIIPFWCQDVLQIHGNLAEWTNKQILQFLAWLITMIRWFLVPPRIFDRTVAQVFLTHCIPFPIASLLEKQIWQKIIENLGQIFKMLWKMHHLLVSELGQF